MSQHKSQTPIHQRIGVFAFYLCLILTLNLLSPQNAWAENSFLNPMSTKNEISGDQTNQNTICIFSRGCDKSKNINKDDLKNLNLKNLDLRKSDFSGSDLNQSNFSRASFAGANLSHASLLNADLSDVQLKEVKHPETIDFRGLDWSKVKVSRADALAILSHSLTEDDQKSIAMQYIKANPNKIDFNQIDWTALSLDPSIAQTILGQTFSSDVILGVIEHQFGGIDLTHINPEALTLSHDELIFLIEKYLKDINWRKKTTITAQEVLNILIENNALIGLDFSGANLTKAKLIGADLTESNLSGANLKGSTLRGATLVNGKPFR